MGRHSRPVQHRAPTHSTTHDEYTVTRDELLEALGIPAGHETAVFTNTGTDDLVIRVHRDTTPPVLYHPASEAAAEPGQPPSCAGAGMVPPWDGHAACRHCQRAITLSPGGVWLDAMGWTQCRKMLADDDVRPLHEPDLRSAA